MRRGRLAATALGAAAATGLVAAVTMAGVEDSSGSERRSRSTETAEVERRDLVSREQWDGTLGYADPRTLPSTLSGTVTWLPAEGSSIPRGGRLYRVDDQSVRLLYGRLPAWRSMSDGTQGADVEQLERNLAALGFTDGGEMDVDGDFDADTADAVENWQEDIGATEDGVVDLGEVVFLEGRRRAGAHETSVGSGIAPGTPVMTTTSTEQVVTVDLDATQQELARESDAVTVELPDGTVLRGRIDTVSSVAETDPEAEEGADPTVEVTVSLRERGPGGLDQAPVEVGLAVDVARDVLAVPVEALLALAEGGYAVEVAEGSTTRLVGVETGLYADGWVEISGQGLEDGTAVVVAR